MFSYIHRKIFEYFGSWFSDDRNKVEGKPNKVEDNLEKKVTESPEKLMYLHIINYLTKIISLKELSDLWDENPTMAEAITRGPVAVGLYNKYYSLSEVISLYHINPDLIARLIPRINEAFMRSILKMDSFIEALRESPQEFQDLLMSNKIIKALGVGVQLKVLLDLWKKIQRY